MLQTFGGLDGSPDKSLLYLRFAILIPSPTLAEAGDGAVYGV
jgi:hypothetical protein